MKTSNTLKRACNLALRRIRFERAHLTLAKGDVSGNDTPAIREATRSYFDAWVEPILVAIRDGDTETLKDMTGNHNCTDPIAEANRKADGLTKWEGDA